MSRLLAAPALRASAAPLGAPDLAQDPRVLAHVARAEQAAYERGVADGRRDGAATAARFASGLADAVNAARAEARALAAGRAQELTELALEMARVVVGQMPPDGGVSVVARVLAAVEDLDEPALRVAVSPADRPLVQRQLAELPTLEVVADVALAPGEARLTGLWARADLTRAAAWQAVVDAVAAAEGAGDA